MLKPVKLLKLLIAGPIVMAAMGLSSSASAQDSFPSKPITFIVPYAPGGAADVFVRTISQKLSERLNVPVIVENRAGANGNIGSAAVARGAADGYTLLLGTSSTITINPHLYKNAMSYDPVKELQPVTLMHIMANVLVVNPNAPYKTVSELVAAAKAKPGALHFGSAGNGNTMHLAGELLKSSTGTEMVHVPYKNGPNALTDVIAGHIPFMFNSVPAVLDFVKSGKVRALAIGSTERNSRLPDVPTLIEAGVPKFESTVWSGVFVKAGTPPAIVKRLNREIVAILETPSFRKPLEDQGFVVSPNTPEQFSALIEKDMKVWGKVVKDSGASIN
jgi:tripartite-type tricarboxylate transporter receptor subunit TctC